MRIHIFLSITFLLLSTSAISQTLRILDDESGAPISNVRIYSNTFTVYTDYNGEAQIDSLKNEQIIKIEHHLYEYLTISYHKLMVNNYQIYLSAQCNYHDDVLAQRYRKYLVKGGQYKQEIYTSLYTRNLYQPQNATDFLEQTSKIIIQNNRQKYGTPLVRGFSGNNLLVFVDGVRINHTTYGNAAIESFNHIDVGSLENSKLVCGPGDVISGCEGFGGTINLNTFSPIIANREKVFFLAGGLARYSSANKEKTVSTYALVSRLNFGFSTVFSYSSYNDVRMGRTNLKELTRPEYVTVIDGQDSIVENTNKNIQKYTGYSFLSSISKVSYKPVRGVLLTYGFYFSRFSEVNRYDKLLQYENDYPKYVESKYQPQNWLMHVFQLNAKIETPAFDRCDVVFSYQDFSEKYSDRKYKSIQQNQYNQQVDVWGIKMNLTKLYGPDIKMIYGADYYHNQVNSDAFAKNILTKESLRSMSIYPDGAYYTDFGAFVSLEYNLFKNLTFNTGIRYSRLSVEADMDTSFYNFGFMEFKKKYQSIVGNIGLKYMPINYLTLYWSISNGYRAPNVSDAGKIYDTQADNFIIPNKNLKPESIYSSEIGIVLAGFSKSHLGLSCFYSYLLNPMMYQHTEFEGQDSVLFNTNKSNVITLNNKSNATIYGFSVDLSVYLSRRFFLYTNFNYMYGRDNDDLPMQFIYPSFGHYEMTYFSDYVKFKFYVNYSLRQNYKNMPVSELSKPELYIKNDNGELYSPAWWTANYKIELNFNNKISFSIGIENILDVRYRQYSSGVVAAGRSFVFGISIL